MKKTTRRKPTPSYSKRGVRMGRPPVEDPLVPTSIGMSEEMRDRLERKAEELGFKSRSQLVVAYCEYCMDEKVDIKPEKKKGKEGEE